MAEHSNIEKVLVLSTAHMPCTNPEFGAQRVVEHEHGYVVFLSMARSPDWLLPIVSLAASEICTLILFDSAASEHNDLPTWDW